MPKPAIEAIDDDTQMFETMLKRLQDAKAEGDTVASFLFPPNAIGLTTAPSVPALILGLLADGMLLYSEPPTTIDGAIDAVNKFIVKNNTIN